MKCYNHHMQVDYNQLGSFQQFISSKVSDGALTLFHQNIRSLNANFLSFDHFLGLMKAKIDLIILGECWMQNIEMYANALQGYKLVHSNQRNKSGGLSVFYLEDRINIIDVSTDVLNGCDCLSLTFSCGNLKQATLLAVYRSPSENPLIFINSLTSYVSQHLDSSLFVLVGDFNICRKKQSSDKNSELFYDNMLEFGMMPLIDTITRPSKHKIDSGSIIDQIFTNFDSIIAYSDIKYGNVDVDITDHKLQYLTIDNQITAAPVSRKKVNVRNYNEKNKAAFSNKLKDLFLPINSNRPPIKNISLTLENTVKLIERTFNEVFTNRVITKREKTNKPWFNKKCTDLLKRKRQLYKSYMKSGSDIDKKRYIESNKLYKNTIKKLKSSTTLIS